MSLEIQPTEEMIKAGVDQLLEDVPGLEDSVSEEQLSDTVVFIWQAMFGAAK